MAKLTVSAREFIQKSYSPCVAVLGSNSVDELCQKNNLSFIELLEPFCVLDKEVSYRDPSGGIIVVNNLQVILSDVNSKPPDPAVARRLLNESVTYNVDKIETSTVQSGSISVQIPTTIPWFEKWRETFFNVQFPSDHEFTKHYLACVIVISSKEENPMDTLSNMVQQFQHMLSMSPPKMMPKWFSSSVLRCYILLHDNSSSDIKKAEKVFEEMKLTYNSNCCHMLQINSADSRMSDPESLRYWKKFRDEIRNTNDAALNINARGFNTPVTGTENLVSEHSKAEILDHPLSPELEKQRLFNSNYPDKNGNEMLDEVDHFQCPGIFLTDDDIVRIRNVVSSFIVAALVPFVETQMQYLNEMVQNKKGVSKSILSATKRLLGAKPTSSVTLPNAHYYHPDSPELQMRRLGDLCFMFGAYNLAFQAYHSVKRDFLDDGALLHYAGALEMASLSAFLIGQDIKKAQEYTDESIITYLNKCRMPQFATRLTLCATECMKSLNLYGEAAGRLLQMTCEDSDLRSALLLEEASYCFIKSRKLFMSRKYAFHLVLAGHRFSKAGQKRHSLRCYRQAYQVYENKNWSLAEDHIHFTIGKLASALKQKEVTAAEFAKLFEKPSSQLPTQQASFLKEYLLSLIEIQKENNGPLPSLQVPRVDHSSIRVALNTCEKTENKENEFVLANKNISEEEVSDKRWWKLEEQLISYINNGLVPVTFKPTINVLSDSTNNTSKPVCIVGERIRTSVDLVNVLNIPFALKEVKLMWTHSAELTNPTIDRHSLVQTEVIECVSVDPDSRNKVSLHITPKVAGEITITGMAYMVTFSPPDSAESINITGFVELTPQGKKIVSTKDRKASDSAYLPDYRLQMLAVEDAPRLKVYFKNLPSEMLCGEVKEITILLENVGTLPTKRIFLTTSEASLFSVKGCKNGSLVLPLHDELIEPGHRVEVTVFLRGCDKSGRVSIDLLFYYDSKISSQQKVKYRLIHHTMHLLIHESLYSSVFAARSVVINDKNKEVINFKIHLHNKNQTYDSVKTKISVEQISLYSSCWKVVDTISVPEKNTLNLEQEQSAFLILQAERKDKNFSYSDLVLHSSNDTILSTNKPLYDFTEPIFNKVLQTNINESEQNKEYSFSDSAVAVNSVLIIFWKADVNIDGRICTTIGVHHIPVLKLGAKYTSIYDTDSQLKPSAVSATTFAFSNLYYNSFSVNEIALVKLKHPPSVSHSFSLNRICCVAVELFVQNCSDDSIEIKLDATYHANSNLSKINESSIFLWLGLVLQTFILSQHSSIRIPLTFCVGNIGTFDLATQLNILARKTNTNDVFVAQSSIPHSLLSITDDIS